MTTTAPKLVRINPDETSGVIDPAHNIEGWLLMKSKAGVGSIFEAFRAASDPGGTVATKLTAEQQLAKSKAALDAKDEELKELVKSKGESDAAAIAAGAKLVELEEKVKELELAKSKGAPAAGEGDTEVDPYAGLPPAVKNLMKSRDDAFAAQLKEATDKADELEKTLMKSREESEIGEEVALLKSRENIAVDADKLGPVLRLLKSISPDAATMVHEALAGADEQLAMNNRLLKSAGTSTKGGPVGGAQEQIDALADAMFEKGLAKSRSAAVLEVVKTNPGLYQQAEAEKAGA